MDYYDIWTITVLAILDYRDIWTIAVWTTMTNFLLGDASLPFDASNIRKDQVDNLDWLDICEV